MHHRKILATIGWMLVFVWLSGPAWSQARPFMVFFDFEKAAMVPEVKKIVADVKKVLKPNARITLTGHCDTAEKDAGKLSLARALEVQQALIELGVPDGTQITVVGRGSAQPMVKTGPNVHDPLNRRVEIKVN